MDFAPFTRRLAASLAVAACVACGAAVPPTHYYALSVPAPSPAAERLPFTAVLMPIRAGNVIKQGRIVYRESPEEVGFYEYHRWAENPLNSVGVALIRKLEARGTFATVVPFDGRTVADFVLRGELMRLEEVDYDGPVRASVEISLELVNTETARVDWTGSAAVTEPVPSSEVRAVVTQLSAAVERSVQQLAGELDKHLRSAG